MTTRPEPPLGDEPADLVPGSTPAHPASAAPATESADADAATAADTESADADADTAVDTDTDTESADAGTGGVETAEASRSGRPRPAVTLAVPRAYRAVAAAGAVLMAVGLLAAIGRPAGSGARPALAARSADAVRATLFCPGLRAAASASTQVVTGTPAPGPGAVSIAAATGAAPAAPATVLTSGRPVGTYAGTLTGPAVLQAAGPLSSGLVGEQLTVGTAENADRGLAEAACRPARSAQWFVGAGTTVGDAAVVVLTNPGAARAIATVSVLTPNGLVDTGPGDNLVLGSHTSLRIPLVTLAPGATATAVQVRTQSGVVAAAVQDVRSLGRIRLGTDWLPASEPATSVIVAGLPGTVAGAPPARTLFVANPGLTAATVQVTATTPDGTAVPTGLDAVAVPPQSVRTVALGLLLGSRPATLTVRSELTLRGRTAPILAGVLVDAGGLTAGGDHDIAFLGGSSALEAPALVPVVRVTAGVDSVLVLSAPVAAAQVTVIVRSPAGGTQSRVLSVGAGRTVAQPLSAWKVPDGASLTLEADGGPVYATRLIEQTLPSGPLLSAYAVTGSPLLRPVPAVAPLPLGQP